MGYMDKDMLIIAICEKFGWTYCEYLDQPQFLIDLIIEKIKIDNQKVENEIKKR